MRARSWPAATTSCPALTRAGIRCDATKPVAPADEDPHAACRSQLDGLAQAVVERDRRFPAEQSLRLLVAPDAPPHQDSDVGLVLDLDVGAGDLDQPLGDLPRGRLGAAADVELLA